MGQASGHPASALKGTVKLHFSGTQPIDRAQACQRNYRLVTLILIAANENLRSVNACVVRTDEKL